MAFPNALFPSIPLYTEVSDEEYKLFHSIDRSLVSTLIQSLGRSPDDALNVVGFLLWLERNRLSSNAVAKVNADWPGYLVEMLADQVVALLEWLKNPVLVWEMRGDISLIQELCNQDVGFADLHERRLEILEGTSEIVNEMSRRGFKDEFGGIEDAIVEDDDGNGVRGGAVHVPDQEQQDQNSSEAGLEDVGGGFINDLLEIISNDLNEAQFGSGSGFVDATGGQGNNSGVEFASGPVRGPRELQNYILDGAGFENRGLSLIRDPEELRNLNLHGVGYGAAGVVYGPRELQNYIRDGAGFENRGLSLIQGPEELRNLNHRGVGYGATGVVYGPRELQNYIRDGAGFEHRGLSFIQDPEELRNLNHRGVGFGAAGVVYGPQELENISTGVRYAAGPFLRLQNSIRNGVPFLIDPRQFHTINHNALGSGMVGGLVRAHREPENIIAGGLTGGSLNELILNNSRVLPNVPFGPRRGHAETYGENLGFSERSEMVNTTRPMPESELCMLLRGLNVQEEETDVHDDDRTIFLTFSRGYPITEPEVWGFFTRRFGNFIKGIHFEEVPEGVQPLYARMVARNSSILPLICDVGIRTRYMINGKHVWAKKYVRKNSTPPPPPSLSTSTST